MAWLLRCGRGRRQGSRKRRPEPAPRRAARTARPRGKAIGSRATQSKSHPERSVTRAAASEWRARSSGTGMFRRAEDGVHNVGRHLGLYHEKRKAAESARAAAKHHDEARKSHDLCPAQRAPRSIPHRAARTPLRKITLQPPPSPPTPAPARALQALNAGGPRHDQHGRRMTRIKELAVPRWFGSPSKPNRKSIEQTPSGESVSCAPPPRPTHPPASAHRRRVCARAQVDIRRRRTPVFPHAALFVADSRRREEGAGRSS